MEIGGSRTSADVVRASASEPRLEMSIAEEWGSVGGIRVAASGVYAMTLAIRCNEEVVAEVYGPTWSIPGEFGGTTQRTGASKADGAATWGPSVAYDFALPAGGAVFAQIAVPEPWGFGWRLTLHLVHEQEIEFGDDT